MFLMPSRVEPCGLGQMIAMRYGAVPIVHRTGGLADTVQNFDPRSGEGDGFVFERYDASELFAAVIRAIEHYRQPEKWDALVRRGMARDSSWTLSARRYVEVYERALELRRAG